VDVDHRQFVGRRLKDCPVVIGLHELSPVGRGATGCQESNPQCRVACAAPADRQARAPPPPIPRGRGNVEGYNSQ